MIEPVSFLRVLWRAWRVVGQVLAGVATIAFRFPRLGAQQRQLEVQDWAQRMLRSLGIALEVRGERPDRGPLLLVANHISWLDILVMHAARHCRFVAKADVKHWPVIGTMATAAGTLYIERESRRDALRVVHRMAESLQAGDILAVFPEGTTSDGTRLLPFHANLLQAAVSADAPVLPVALQFFDADTGRISRSVCYIDDDTLIGSIWRTLAGPSITAVVSYGQPQRAGVRDRRAWAVDLRSAVETLRQS